MSDLFDNPMVRRARAAMSEEQLAEYKAKGEMMYGGRFDVTSSNLEQEGRDFNEIEAVAWVVESLKSGLMVQDLEDNERELLKAHYGDNWQAMVAKK